VNDGRGKPIDPLTFICFENVTLGRQRELEVVCDDVIDCMPGIFWAARKFYASRLDVDSKSQLQVAFNLRYCIREQDSLLLLLLLQQSHRVSFARAVQQKIQICCSLQDNIRMMSK
jgi:hypothetical protein